MKKISKIINLVSVLFLLILISSCSSISTQNQLINQYEMKAVQYRIARPTNNLKEVVSFYKNALGLEVIGSFENHEGYDGVMLGLPDKTYHLEFTQHIDKLPLPEPTKENLLIFYYDSPQEYEKVIKKFTQLGLEPVEPENPYWKNKSTTYEDPDKWRIVLFNGVYTPYK
ncbi:VOC family protein [Flavobacterium sp.]|jgi:hypothetical protein|uniref:VOC family protein n=1 Tax=Flavobacterium sp. TaxID=239 RepID=UPI0037C018CE